MNVLKKSILSLVVFSFVFSSSVYAQNVVYSENVAAEMANPQYWLDKTKNSEKVILNQAEIKKYNEKTMKQMTSIGALYNLDEFPKTVSGDKIKNYINIDNFNWQAFEINGSQIDEAYISSIKDNLNYDAISEENTVSYGITVKRSNLVMMPSFDDFIATPAQDFDNMLQITEVLYNEPVIIVHKSKDSKWCYCICEASSGWLPSENIALCSDADEWNKAKSLDSFLVVTGDDIYLEYDATKANRESSAFSFSMGTILPLADSVPEKVEGRLPINCYVVYLPIRNELGMLEYEYRLVPISRDVNVGYLPYTTDNVLRLAFKKLGNVYGWGGTLDSDDCSGYIRNLYRCFGFNFPRNSSKIAITPFKYQDISEKTVDEKKKIFDKLLPGSLVYMKGHIMIYLGKENDMYYVINSIGTYIKPNETEITQVLGVNVNTLDVKRSSGKTWLEDIASVNQITK